MNKINVRQQALKEVGNSRKPWLSVPHIIENLEEKGFVVETTDTSEKAFLFVADEQHKKIAYNPKLSEAEQAHLLLDSYCYYVLNHESMSNGMLKYVSTIPKRQQEEISKLEVEIRQLSLQKEMVPEKFGSLETEKLQYQKHIS